MQFVVTAYDYKDDDAINRRMAAREDHLAGIKESIAQGIFKSGGALLDDDGKMVGSCIHVEIENEEALKEWIDNDPYSKEKVWEVVEIQKMKLVPQG